MRWALVALLVIAAPAAAQDLDWRKRADRTTMANGFGRMADYCTKEFGFTRVVSSPGEMPDKIEAHLLLESSASVLVERWYNIYKRTRATQGAAKDDRLIERLGDAMVAAHRDPATRDRAQALFVETMMAPVLVSLEGCRTASTEPFLGKHFVAGTGTAEHHRLTVMKQFNEGVAALAAERG